MAHDTCFFLDTMPWSRYAASELRVLVQVQKRVWYSCVKLETFLACFRGRPPMVRRAEYTCTLPDEDEDDETEPWLRPGMSSGPPSRALSTFNASARLAAIVSRCA